MIGKGKELAASYDYKQATDYKYRARESLGLGSQGQAYAGQATAITPPQIPKGHLRAPLGPCT